MMETNRRKFIKESALMGLMGVSSDTLPFYEKIQLENNSVFLFQGDSITDGNRGRNDDLNHIMGHGYAYAVASRIGADFPASNFQFINKGVSGNAIPDLLKRWKEDALDLHPQVLSLLVGINDVNAVVNQYAGFQSIDEFKSGYRSLLDQVMLQNPKTLLVLGLPFVAKGTRTNAKFDLFELEVKERANYIKEIAQEFNGLIVDYPTVFEQAYKNQSIAYWIWDGVHPTVFGHELMAREWIKVVSKKLPFLRKYKY
jgi:lysophospholipase L1-like esterase